MGSHAHAEGVRRLSGAATDPTGAFSTLLQAAAVEFLSTLQLLAERARFLTGADGVGIALKENREFIYRATAGRSPETGSLADTGKAPIAKCIATAQASLISTHTGQGQAVKAAVPITQHGDVVGFFELIGSTLIPDDDLRAVSSLAEMVTTAIEHVHAAENAHKQIAENANANRSEEVASLSWHAQAATQPPPKQTAAPASIAPLKVHACQSCGFPISDARQLCVECEQKPNAPKLPSPQLLANENDQSWIDNHGYTVASLLITALVIAIIYWLR